MWCKIQKKTKGYSVKSKCPSLPCPCPLPLPGASHCSQVLLHHPGRFCCQAFLWLLLFFIFIIAQANLRLMSAGIAGVYLQCHLLPSLSLSSEQLSCFESLEVKPPFPVEFIGKKPRRTKGFHQVFYLAVLLKHQMMGFHSWWVNLSEVTCLAEPGQAQASWPTPVLWTATSLKWTRAGNPDCKRKMYPSEVWPAGEA